MGYCLKGVCHELLYLYFYDSNPSGPLTNRPKYSRILFRFRWYIQIFKKLRGVCPSTESISGEEALALWGNDPVHPSDLAYQKLTKTISDDINCPPMAASRPWNTETPRPDNRPSTATPRESWTLHTQRVASRRGRWSEHQRSSGHTSRSRGHKHSLHKRRPRRQRPRRRRPWRTQAIMKATKW